MFGTHIPVSNLNIDPWAIWMICVLGFHEHGFGTIEYHIIWLTVSTKHGCELNLARPKCQNFMRVKEAWASGKYEFGKISSVKSSEQIRKWISTLAV